MNRLRSENQCFIDDLNCLEEIHESFEGIASLLLDGDFAGDGREPLALPVCSNRLRGTVTAGLDSDLAKQTFVAKVDESHQGLCAAQVCEMEHHGVGDTCNIHVGWVHSQSAYFPGICMSRVGSLGGELGKHR